VATHFSHVCVEATEGCSTTAKRLMPIKRDKRDEKLLCITHFLFSLALMIRKRGGKPPRTIWAWTLPTGVAVVNKENYLTCRQEMMRRNTSDREERTRRAQLVVCLASLWPWSVSSVKVHTGKKVSRTPSDLHPTFFICVSELSIYMR
jgi:hypothetical protein